MNTITSNLRWQASGLLLFCRAKNLISFFFLSLSPSPSLLHASLHRLFHSPFSYSTLNARHVHEVYSMVSGPFVVHFTALSASHKWHSTISRTTANWMPAVTLFLVTSCDPRCWCLRLMCALRLWIYLFTQRTHTRKEHDMAANATRPKKKKKNGKNKNQLTTIFHARIVRIGRQEPPEYDNRLIVLGEETTQENQIGICTKNGKKIINKRGFTVVSFREFRPFIFRYVLFGDVWRAPQPRPYCVRWRTVRKTISWEKKKTKRNVILNSVAKFCVFLNEKNRRKKKTENIWKIWQSKESVCAAKYHRSQMSISNVQHVDFMANWGIFHKNKK